MLRISQLFIYPIKSLGGIEVASANLTDRGFEYDRRWMLVDEKNRFISQREIPQMALLKVAVTNCGLRITHKKGEGSIQIPFIATTTETTKATIWDDECDVQFVSPIADEWFSEILGESCRLVYMPDVSERKVDADYAINQEITSLSDGYPLLMVGQASLDDLNRRLAKPLPINRFRPNIVFTGGQPFEEDNFPHFTINNIVFYGVKPCGRCAITTINQDTAAMSKEPLKTLATFRLRNNKVLFGQNLLFKGSGMLKIGDEIHLIKGQ